MPRLVAVGVVEKDESAERVALGLLGHPVRLVVQDLGAQGVAVGSEPLRGRIGPTSISGRTVAAFIASTAERKRAGSAGEVVTERRLVPVTHRTREARRFRRTARAWQHGQRVRTTRPVCAPADAALRDGAQCPKNEDR
ncbi:hypothetical protein NJ76_21455 [Rhodococcus sp. IITR03]|nr:hypothetical protein NJ76_21455 [Rhodococcus sp. IITR03]